MSKLQIEKKYKKKKKLGSYPYFGVVFSITLALFIMGLFGLLLLHTTKLTQLIRENIEIQVYLDKDITESESMKINKILTSKDYVVIENEEPQIRFITKDEAAKQFIADTGEDFTHFLGENPLRDAFVINIKPEYHTAEKLAEIRSNVENITGVFEVTYVESLIDSINKNITKISFVLAGFALVLLITVIFLINNTIKLALFSQRFLIRSMQLVGAKSSFIQKPFLFRATLHGILGGILASLLLFLLMQYANTQVSDLAKLQDMDKIILLLAMLLALGAIIGAFSTYRAIKKYLKMSLDELY